MKTYKLNLNDSEGVLTVTLGYSPEKLEDFVNENRFNFVVNEPVVILKGLSEEDVKKVNDKLQSLELEVLNEFIDITKLNELKNEIEMALDVIGNLTVAGVEEEDSDDVEFVIDDIISAEERCVIIKNAIMINQNRNPMLDKSPIIGLYQMLDSMASSRINDASSLDALGKRELGETFDYLSAKDSEKTIIKKIALIDFLVANSSSYVRTYSEILERVRSILAD